MAARVSGDWEHGACLWPLAGNAKYATVPVPVLCTASRRVASPSGFTEYFQASVDLSKKKREREKNLFLEGLEVDKLVIVIASMQEGIIHGGISLSRY